MAGKSKQPDPGAQDGTLGMGRLRQLLSCGRKVYKLGSTLDAMEDRRKEPRVSMAVIVRIVFVVALLRIRSFNALEPRLAEARMQRMLGLREVDRKICSVDTMSYGLQRAEVVTLRAGVVNMVKRAERNKVFREGWHGALRYVALDAWEPHSSRSRCCSACLTRKVKVGKQKVTEYYHKYVVALLIDEMIEVVVDMEPVRSADVRKEMGDKNVAGHEGELTAAKRLVPRLRETYGRWIDVLVVDALYSNGPFLTVAKEYGFGVIAVIKKTTDEPLKDALALWNGTPPQQVATNKKKGERVELWDCPGIETLSSYRGAIRVVRGIVHKSGKHEPSTWCFAVTGKACKLSSDQVLKVGRGRWHLENTGFNQWTQCWRLSHVFTHGPEASPAIFWLFFLAFNLLQLFAYRHLGGYGRDRGKDVTKTLWRLVDEMIGDLERFDLPFQWNTS